MTNVYKRLMLAAILSAGVMSSEALAQAQTFSKRIVAGTDDAEQRGNGSMYLDSSDLELTEDGGDRQEIGLRFTEVSIPAGAIIRKAFIQFTVDETSSGASSMMIKGEAADNPGTYTTTDLNLSARATTASSVAWEPANWSTVSEAGENQATPDLKTVVQEIVSRQGWMSGNAMAFVLTGTGRRTAEAFEGEAHKAAQLVVEYEMAPATSIFPVAKNSVWKFNDKGMDLGTSWKSEGFDDSAWEHGAGVLGYGDPVATTMSYGGDANNKYPTYYLRHNFILDDASLYESVTFNIRRDDGTVVYLNGVEQFRSNLPAGDINYNTWALTAIDGANETAYTAFTVPASALKSGNNVIAVEMHQQRANSSDLTFDMEVTGTLIPTLTDKDVFTPGGEWKYLDNGSDQGAAWRAAGFDDAAWKSGSGVFGHGDGNEMTSISYGDDAANKHITTYFRKTFNVTDKEGYQALEMSLVRDDAAVVYLNGTEVLRSNLGAGDINHQTLSAFFVEGADETTPFIAYINKDLLLEGANTLAVEVHKFNATDTDMRFDLGLRLLADSKPLTPVVVAIAPASDKIGSFISVKPQGQGPAITIPTETHTFQLIAKSGTTTYTGTNETLPGNNDFTGYVSPMGSSTEGYLSINHENSPGGVSMLNLNLDESAMIWQVGNIRKVDFSPVNSTVRNCSGGVTPWGTIITSEENTSAGDRDGDGYQDIGWQVEIDPITNLIRDYDGDGKPDKLWALGRMNHENIAVGADMVTAYQAEDGGTGCVYKFVADQPGNLSAGKMYVLKRSATNPAMGEWVLMPNTTQADRNNAPAVAGALGGTNWSGPEDIEFGPDGKMYFTAKGTGIIWRFKDDGETVSEVEAWVGGQNTAYPITHQSGVQNENWGTGIDNLTFDGEGNLWALQDGGRNHLWVIRPDHTPENPKVELFMTTPAGSEPTGLTFSPDFRYGFVSLQHPSGSNNVVLKDAAGNDVRFNNDITMVFARKEYLGTSAVEPAFALGDDMTACESDEVELKAFEGADAVIKWSNGATGAALKVTEPGTYTATAYANNGKTFTDEITINFENPVVDLGGTRTINAGETVTLDAGEGFSSYLWSNGSTARTLPVTVAGTYSVTATTANGCTATSEVVVSGVTAMAGDEAVARKVEVYPNPIRSAAKVNLNLTEASEVTLEVYDLTGKRVQTLANGKLNGGQHNFEFKPAATAAQGMYLLRISINGKLASKKLLYAPVQ